MVGAVKLESPGRIHNGASSPIPAAGHKLVGNVTGCSLSSLVYPCRYQTYGNITMGLPLPSLLVTSLLVMSQDVLGSSNADFRHVKAGSQHNGSSSAFPRLLSICIMG